MSGSNRSATGSPTLRRQGGSRAGSGRGSPRGSDSMSKSSDLMDVDADGEVDADAESNEADTDADTSPNVGAEQLEAVDAAEANNVSDEEWLKRHEPGTR